MKRSKQVKQFKSAIAVATLALCVVALALPAATAWALETEWPVARLEDDGYGTAWFVDPGEWYEGPAAAAAPASEASAGNAGYLTAWFVDPGEWYDATAEAAVPAGEAANGDAGSRISWFRDPREVERCDC